MCMLRLFMCLLCVDMSVSFGSDLGHLCLIGFIWVSLALQTCICSLLKAGGFVLKITKISVYDKRYQNHIREEEKDWQKRDGSLHLGSGVWLLISVLSPVCLHLVTVTLD